MTINFPEIELAPYVLTNPLRRQPPKQSPSGQQQQPLARHPEWRPFVRLLYHKLIEICPQLQEPFLTLLETVEQENTG